MKALDKPKPQIKRTVPSQIEIWNEAINAALKLRVNHGANDLIADGIARYRVELKKLLIA